MSEKKKRQMKKVGDDEVDLTMVAGGLTSPARLYWARTFMQGGNCIASFSRIRCFRPDGGRHASTVHAEKVLD